MLLHRANKTSTWKYSHHFCCCFYYYVSNFRFQFFVFNISHVDINETTRSMSFEGGTTLPLFLKPLCVWIEERLNGNTLNNYWEARSACTAWRVPSSYKAPWTQTETAPLKTASLNDSYQWIKKKRKKLHYLHYMYIRNGSNSCFNMRFLVLTLLWFTRVQLHVPDTCPWLVTVCLQGSLKIQSYMTSTSAKLDAFSVQRLCY